MRNLTVKPFVLCFLIGLSAMMNGCFGYIEDHDSRQTKQKLKQQNVKSLDYLLYLPPDYDKQDLWPLIVFLHGAGQKGSNLEKVKIHGPPRLIEAGKDLPFIVASPQCRMFDSWTKLDREVIGLVDELVETYNVDKNRIYLTGMSIGGNGTWAIGCSNPERFAAIVPVCGGGRPSRADALKDVPVWAFHGAKDIFIPMKKSRRMVDAVNEAGGDARLTVYPDVGHFAWSQTYENPKLYEWLLSQKKTQD